MMRRILFSGLITIASYQASLNAHCQMPCGIYHDEMVFDQIDQFVETTAKGLTMLTDNEFKNVQDHNEFVRWVIQKEKSSDEIAQIFCTYFLQQKIKPGEEDTSKRVLSVHKLLFLLVKLKQTVDLKVLNDFYEEWERFKLMFHIEGYKCKMEQIKLKKWAEKHKAEQVQPSQFLNQSDHDHDHDHTH